jgi:hypothetical protein
MGIIGRFAEDLHQVAPPDRFQLPLRWEFVPEEDPRDRAVRWKWLAYTQSGRLALESDNSFETLSECMDHARQAGYGQ